MITNTNMKTIGAVIAVVAIGALGYVLFPFLPARNAAPKDAQGAVQTPFVFQGIVTNVDTDELQITVAAAATASTQKIVKIDPATKIEEVISQKGADGSVEKQGVAEVNLRGLREGIAVTVTYRNISDAGDILENVDRIAFVTEGNLDAYFAQARESEAASPVVYVKGRVGAVDAAGRQISYQPYFFDVTATTTESVIVPDGAPFYTIEDPARVSIVHARVPAAFTDVQPGQTIFISADAEALRAGKVEPQAFIIVGE